MKLWKPHSYQRTAISFLLANPVGGLFLDPGLGKTSISLAAMKILRNALRVKGVLLIAPLRVIYSVWPQEIAKWSNFKDTKYTILHEGNRHTIWSTNSDIYAINPEGLEWLHDELLDKLTKGRSCPFNILWIDESTKFKNHESQRFKYIVSMLPLFKRRYIMTGTPAPKGYLDLWSQIYILDEGKALDPNYHKYRRTYFQAEDWNKYDWQLRDFCEERIQKAVSPIVLEMSNKDYLDMPDLIYNNIVIDLPAKKLKQYKKMEKEYFISLDDMEASAKQAADASIKCHQIANGKVYEDIPEGLTYEDERDFRKNRKVIHIHKEKVTAIQDLIDELNGKPLLVSYQFRHDFAALQDLLGVDVPHIGRGVKPEKALELELQWNQGLLPVLIVHPSTVAHGLNLQESGNDICWFSLTWNLEEYQQLIARIYRQGVTGGEVRVHHLICNNTIDQAMLMRLGERAKQQQDLRKAIKKYRLSLKI